MKPSRLTYPPLILLMKKHLLFPLALLLTTGALSPVAAQLPRPFLVTSACPSANNNPSVLRRMNPDNSLSTIGTINLAGTPIIVNGLGSDLADPGFVYAMSTVTGAGIGALAPPTFYRINLLNGSATSFGEVTPPPTPTPPPGSPPGSFGVSYAINLAADGAPGSRFFLTGAAGIARITSFIPTLTVQVSGLRLYIGEISLQPVPNPAAPTWRQVDISDPATTAIVNGFQTAINNYLNGVGPLPSGGFQDIAYVPSTGNLISYLGVDNQFITVSNIGAAPVAVTTTPATLLPVAAQNREVGSVFRDGSGSFYAQVSDNGIAYQIDPLTGNYLGNSINLGVGCSRGDATTAPPIVVLPVELTSFTAGVGGGQVRLAWRTATEQKVDRFVIERSADGRSWEAVKAVAARNLPEGASYETADERPSPAAKHYRLRVQDLDGSVSYSATRVVEFGKQATLLAPYPNPATGHFTIALSSPAEGAARLINEMGQIVWQEPLHGGAVEAQVASLPTGVYQLVVTLADGSITTHRVALAR